MKRVFKNAKVIGANIANDVYLRQGEGIVRGHRDFVMSRSELMLFASNPSRWKAGYVFKDSDATYFGSLMDCLLTDSARFDQRYVIRPKTVKATKTMTCVKEGENKVGDDVPWRECSEAKDWKAANADKEIVPAEDYEEAQQAMTRLFEDEKIKSLVLCSAKQVMVIAEFHDKETGLIIPVKILIDLVPDFNSKHGNELADYKTCRSAAPKQWSNVVFQRNYDAQAALIFDVFTQATGEDRDTFLHVLQENQFPFQTGRRIIGEAFLQLGRMKYISALKLYAKCLLTNTWPSWDDVGLDGWSMTEPEPYMMDRLMRDEMTIHPPPVPDPDPNVREGADDIIP